MDDSSTVTFHSMSSGGPAIIRVCLLLSASDFSFVIVLLDLLAHLLCGSTVSLSLDRCS